MPDFMGSLAKPSPLSNLPPQWPSHHTQKCSHHETANAHTAPKLGTAHSSGCGRCAHHSTHNFILLSHSTPWFKIKNERANNRRWPVSHPVTCVELSVRGHQSPRPQQHKSRHSVRRLLTLSSRHSSAPKQPQRAGVPCCVVL